MAFVQIIELKTSKLDELRALNDEWEKATEGKRKVRRVVVTQDRNDPARCLMLVFFDSYEEAMENSNMAETQNYAPHIVALTDGEPIFHDLDVLEDRAL